MTTTFPDLWLDLAAPFAPAEIRQRKAERDASSRKVYWYLSVDSIKARLDSVLGIEGWWDEYTETSAGVLCKLTIRLPDGSTLCKQNSGLGRDIKASVSDALKRAADRFDVGWEIRALNGGRGPAITPGQDLIIWAYRTYAETRLDLVSWLARWGASKGYPTRILEWSREQTDLAHAAAAAKVKKQVESRELATTNGRHS